MIYRGYKLTAFQQFRGVWLARYEATAELADDVRAGGLSGDVGGLTKRRALAMCKAEVYHLHRSARIRATSSAYYSVLSRRFNDRWQRSH